MVTYFFRGGTFDKVDSMRRLNVYRVLTPTRSEIDNVGNNVIIHVIICY